MGPQAGCGCCIRRTTTAPALPPTVEEDASHVGREPLDVQMRIPWFVGKIVTICMGGGGIPQHAGEDERRRTQIRCQLNGSERTQARRMSYHFTIGSSCEPALDGDAINKRFSDMLSDFVL